MKNVLQLKRDENPNNPNQRAYFSREELTKISVYTERGDPLTFTEDPIVRSCLEIVGVDCVILKPYCLVITKGPMFEWNEIEPSILRLMSAFNLGEGRLLKVKAEWESI